VNVAQADGEWGAVLQALMDWLTRAGVLGLGGQPLFGVVCRLFFDLKFSPSGSPGMLMIPSGG